ncbi:MAG TPA: cytochrome P450 [Myxococcota bacterium]|nr:cytochrome P450 [Myxococcota bacterium]
MSASDFDVVDFFHAGRLYQDPYPYYEYLRAHGPVWREPRRGLYMVTGYEESLSVYHDTDTFSNANVVTGPFAEWPEPLVGDDVSALIEKHRDQIPFNDQLPSFDPPKHTAHRSLLGRLLTPKRLKENEDFMWRLADRQVDEFLARGECEFIHDYADPFTLLVIADLLGVPEEQHAQFREEMQGEREGMVGEHGTVTHGPMDYLYERFTKFIEERRREPRNDVMTAMATATFPDGTLPEVRDVMLIAANLFSAGQETTARLLGQMFKLIGERPELQQLLRDERERIPNFVEECLRLEPPIQGTFRLARVSTQIGGVPVPAGASVLLLPGAANRDPRRFEAPDEFRLDRPNWRQHATFGSGVHSCAGAPLARAEARVSAERLLDRLADIRISEKAHGPAGARRYQYPNFYMLRGLVRLHLEFTPIG